MKEGWEIRKLGDCFKLKSGDMLSSKMMVEGDYPVFGGNGIAGNHNYFNLEGDNIIIGRVGALCGNVRLIKSNIWLTDNAFYLTDFKYSFDKNYLTHYLNYINLRDYARQAAQPVISNSSLNNVIIVIPPLLIQQRIASILDQAFASIDKAKANAEQNLKNAREIYHTYLEGVFRKKGDDWEHKKFRDVCQYDKNLAPQINLPYVGLEDIESNTGRFIGSGKPQNVKSSTFKFNEKHVLYGRLRPYLNKVLLPNFEGHCSTEIFPIKVDERVLRDFLYYWLTDEATVKKIDATSTGARMPRANMNQVLDFEFSYPEIETQYSIVNQLNALRLEIQKIQTIYQKKIGYLEELKKSILQKAFAGELTMSEPLIESV